MIDSAKRRDGFTLIEMTVACGLAIVVLGMVASLAAWNLQDRLNHRARHVAIEAADNLLEEARSIPWGQLTPAWGESRTLSENPSLPDGKAVVVVADEKSEAGLKRVTATVSWAFADDRRQTVELVGFFADRPIAAKAGAK